MSDDPNTLPITELHNRLKGPPVSYAALAHAIDPTRYADFPQGFLVFGDDLLRHAIRHGVPALADVALNKTLLLDRAYIDEFHRMLQGRNFHSLDATLREQLGYAQIGHIANKRAQANLLDANGPASRSPLEQTYNAVSLGTLRSHYQPNANDISIAEAIRNAGLSVGMTASTEEARRLGFYITSRPNQPRPYPYDLQNSTQAELEGKRLEIARMILDQPALNLLLPREDGLREGDIAFTDQNTISLNPYDPDVDTLIGLTIRSEIVLRTLLEHAKTGGALSFRPSLPVIHPLPEDGDDLTHSNFASKLFNLVGDEVTKRLNDPEDVLGVQVKTALPKSELTYWQSGEYRISPADVKRVFEEVDDVTNDDIDPAMMNRLMKKFQKGISRDDDTAKGGSEGNLPPPPEPPGR